ncbi:hypothetical protein FHR84_004027 [Actinopolyspora biskrensis]|uniref:Uncharacterized protein n=1 Tax=Actinopolyspora biskrensis TaxID=1470178 RepID=A0A852Z1J7_9ACTN|nr:hypothetical protein [Actinopolyspora biskrensis]NYH80661.1 hypothetical protein [Actinopolyspora biskrensis]
MTDDTTATGAPAWCLHGYLPVLVRTTTVHHPVASVSYDPEPDFSLAE